jgi:uncharacterized protein with von Willebrand factor type A (vWA) domain
MGLLSDLYDRARSLLARAPAGTATDVIPRGTLDELVFDEVLDYAPPLRELVEDLNDKYAATRALVADAWSTFYLPRPKPRGKDEVAPSHLHNWAAITALNEAPETGEAQAYTQLDQYGAAMATISFGSKLRSLLEDSSEAEEAEQEAQAAQQALQQAVSAAAQAAEANDEAQAGSDEGAQEAAARALEAATEALGDALGSSEQAQALAEAAIQAATEQARRKFEGAAGEAAKEAAEQLADEEELFQAWGVEDGQVKHWSFEERQRMAALLRKSPVTQHLQLMGRFKYCERSTRTKQSVFGRDEVYDIERSARLEDVLASELAMLANRHTKRDFLARLGEGQLLSRAYRGTEREGKGAIIVCVDTSDSMNWGRPGYKPASWSKAFALALLERAKAEQRDFVGIIFSSKRQVQTFSFPKGRGTVEQVVEFVTKAYNGGTDFEAPLNVAMNVLVDQYSDAGLQRGDIVFITDDNCKVSDEFMAEYKQAKADVGFRTWGIACGKKRPGHTLDALSDDVRAIEEFHDPSPVHDLMRAI